MIRPIWVYTVCYNEQHFVKNFLSAYEEAERIVVYDNMSTDNTRELLHQDPRVEIRHYDSGGKIRDDLYLDIKNHAWKEARGKADWVIVVDFDEIFCNVQLIDNEPVFNLDLSLAEEFDLIQPVGYNMVSLNAPLGAEGHPFKYSKNGLRHPPNDKICCFRPDKVAEMRYYSGAHNCDPLDMNYKPDALKIVCGYPNFRMLHYKFWNLDQYMERMADYQTRMSEVNKGMGWAWHYMLPLEEHKNTFVNGSKIVKYLFDPDNV